MYSDGSSEGNLDLEEGDVSAISLIKQHSISINTGEANKDNPLLFDKGSPTND